MDCEVLPTFAHRPGAVHFQEKAGIRLHDCRHQSTHAHACVCRTTTSLGHNALTAWAIATAARSAAHSQEDEQQSSDTERAEHAAQPSSPARGLHSLRRRSVSDDPGQLGTSISLPSPRLRAVSETAAHMRTPPRRHVLCLVCRLIRLAGL